MTETIPFDIPGYAIEGLIGRGGMGRVYRAEQIATRRPVAIKLLTGAGVDPERLAGFRREAATLAQLEHPRIVPLYDYGERAGVPYLVVRFLGGGTVADRLKPGPIELRLALRWIRDVAEALDAAHRRGITHRDVKPSNLLLDEAGNIYLGDFGIAAAEVDLASAPHSGSAAYASPEQARGEAPGPASDVYSLAATAFEMITGEKPYQAETALGMIVRHQHDPVPSARARMPSLSAAIDSALASGMAKRPEERPASAGAFARRLLEAGAAPIEPLDMPTEPLAPPAPRSRAVVAGLLVLTGVACLAVLAVLGGGLTVWATSPGEVATATRPPAMTVPAIPSPVRAGPTIPLIDDFSDPGSGFVTEEDADGRLSYAEGEYHISILTPGIVWFGPHQHIDERDLRIEVDGRLPDGPVIGEIGVVCRWQDGENYVGAALRSDGWVSIWRLAEGAEERLVDWRPGAGVGDTATGWRRLQLTCSGPEVRFAVDGSEAADAVDPSPSSGSIALLAGLLGEGELTAAFDNLEVGRP